MKKSWNSHFCADVSHVSSAVVFATILMAIAALGHAQTLTTLYTFTGGADGGAPKGTLVQGKDGNFYGTTSGPGTVFKITPDGTLTTLHTFTSADGVGPFGTLALGNDGNFYGTATLSNPGAGTIFADWPERCCSARFILSPFWMEIVPGAAWYWAEMVTSTGLP